MKPLKKLRDLIHTLLINLVLHVRPLLGDPGCCKFTVSCTQYAREALSNYNTLQAFSLILKRVFQCH